MKRRRFNPTRWLAGILIFAVCLVILASNSGHQEQEQVRALWGDTSPLGGQGLRLVLEKLGYHVALQNEPLRQMPPKARVWLLIDPQTRFSKHEGTLLMAWVRGGGTLFFCARPRSFVANGVTDSSPGIELVRGQLGIVSEEPAYGPSKASSDLMPTLSPFSLDAISLYRTGVKSATGSDLSTSISRPELANLEIAGAPGGTIERIDVGKGRVFVLPDALLLTNYALSKPDNAVLVTNLIRIHAPSGDVYFDQRQNGEDSLNSEPKDLIWYLKQPPVSYAIWQLLLAGLLFWAYAGRRLGEPVPIPEGGPVTRASQFAAAMGGLFSKTNRPGAAAAIIGTRFRRRLAARLGLSPAEEDRILARRAQEVAGIPFDLTNNLLLESRTPGQSLAQALRNAQEMELVLRRLEGRD